MANARFRFPIKVVSDVHDFICREFVLSDRTRWVDIRLNSQRQLPSFAYLKIAYITQGKYSQGNLGIGVLGKCGMKMRDFCHARKRG